jgi:hypothetical protein
MREMNYLEIASSTKENAHEFVQHSNMENTFHIVARQPNGHGNRLGDNAGGCASIDDCP